MFSEESRKAMILVTDHLPADGTTDVSDALQALIDENPNRTLYFPDGTYLISKPILTPADPKRSVALRFDNFATLKAAPDWDSDEAMLRLGASHPANDIRTPGSNYSLVGGIFDGSGVAKGISIDGGRETMIRDVSMKQVQVGLHIKWGANSASSDCDILNVNIVGNGKPDSIGVLLEGYDNTLTNMRIADVHIGLDIRSAGNSLRNLHPLYTCDYTDYQNSCGFYDHTGSNWYSFCYSDHFGNGFRFADGVTSILDSCFCMWYTNRGEYQTAILADGKFNSIFKNYKIGFHKDSTANKILSVAEDGGTGLLDRLLFNLPLVNDTAHLPYVIDGIHHI